MPRSSAQPKPAPKRGKKTPKTSAEKPRTAPLTPAEQAFQAAVRECTPQERLFLKHKLGGKNNTEAAKLAGYSPRTAEEQGARLLGRVRVYAAYQAGLVVAGFGPADILEDIRGLRSFDRSQIEREVQEIETVIVERPVEDMIVEILKKERAVSDFLDGLDVDDDTIVADLKKTLHKLLHERLQLEMELAVNPDATTYAREARTVTKRVIDYDKARDLGLLKYIKGVKPTKYGDMVEVYDWTDGVQMAARSVGLFVERREHSGPGGGPVQTETTLRIDDLNGEQLAQHYAALMEQVNEQ